MRNIFQTRTMYYQIIKRKPAKDLRGYVDRVTPAHSITIAKTKEEVLGNLNIGKREYVFILCRCT